MFSSVAAQRPRASNYVYGAFKAGLDAFARGLQLTTRDAGVRVLIARLGFVRTRMTAHLRPPPLSIHAERAGAEIAAAITGSDDVVWVPSSMRIVMWAVSHAPRMLIEKL